MSDRRVGDPQGIRVDGYAPSSQGKLPKVFLRAELTTDSAEHAAKLHDR